MQRVWPGWDRSIKYASGLISLKYSSHDTGGTVRSFMEWCNGGVPTTKDFIEWSHWVISGSVSKDAETAINVISACREITELVGAHSRSCVPVKLMDPMDIVNVIHFDIGAVPEAAIIGTWIATHEIMNLSEVTFIRNDQYVNGTLFGNVILPPWCTDMIDRYLRLREKNYPTDSEYLFTKYSGARIGTRRMKRIGVMVMVRHGIDIAEEIKLRKKYVGVSSGNYVELIGNGLLEKDIMELDKEEYGESF